MTEHGCRLSTAHNLAQIDRFNDRMNAALNTLLAPNGHQIDVIVGVMCDLDGIRFEYDTLESRRGLCATLDAELAEMHRPDDVDFLYIEAFNWLPERVQDEIDELGPAKCMRRLRRSRGRFGATLPE